MAAALPSFGESATTCTAFARPPRPDHGGAPLGLGRGQRVPQARRHRDAAIGQQAGASGDDRAALHRALHAHARVRDEVDDTGQVTARRVGGGDRDGPGDRVFGSVLQGTDRRIASPAARRRR